MVDLKQSCLLWTPHPIRCQRPCDNTGRNWKHRRLDAPQASWMSAWMRYACMLLRRSTPLVSLICADPS